MLESTVGYKSKMQSGNPFGYNGDVFKCVRTENGQYQICKLVLSNKDYEYYCSVVLISDRGFAWSITVLGKSVSGFCRFSDIFFINSKEGETL